MQVHLLPDEPCAYNSNNSTAGAAWRDNGSGTSQSDSTEHNNGTRMDLQSETASIGTNMDEMGVFLTLSQMHGQA